jgi:hypothetical protein
LIFRGEWNELAAGEKTSVVVHWLFTRRRWLQAAVHRTSTVGFLEKLKQVRRRKRTD